MVRRGLNGARSLCTVAGRANGRIRSGCWCLADEQATLQLGSKLAQATQDMLGGMLLFLRGELGVGKSCFVRGFLLAKGWRQAVPSPSFSLREDYWLPDGGCVAHLDLYRLKDPEELNYLGWEELWNDQWTVMIEWPEIGQDYLPAPDLCIDIELGEMGRVLTVTAMNSRAEYVLQRMTEVVQ